MSFVLPELFEEKMKTLLGEEWTAFWESYSQNRFQALRLNLLKKDVTLEKKDYSSVSFEQTGSVGAGCLLL